MAMQGGGRSWGGWGVTAALFTFAAALCAVCMIAVVLRSSYVCQGPRCACGLWQCLCPLYNNAIHVFSVTTTTLLPVLCF